MNPNRCKSQSMGLWLNEAILRSPEKLDEAVLDLARSGYGIIRTMLRNTNLNHRSPTVIEGVARITELAHTKGLRVVLDCEPHAEPVARDMGNLFPNAIGMRIVRAETAVVNGKFSFHIDAPLASGTRADFLGVEGAWLEKVGEVRKIDDLEFEYRIVGEPYSNGFTTNNHAYSEGRPIGHHSCLHLSGKLPHSVQGRLVIYVRFFDTCVLDFWSEEFRSYYDRVLESYRGIPLDGVGWDEPGIGGSWLDYLWGNATAAAFKRRNGYALKDKWIHLDAPAVEAESLRVRLDYYRTLNEGIFEAQKHLFAKARQIFGNHLLLGTHHTWQGEGGINDYRAGAVDYFRLNDNMDAGYTDCWWWDIKSVCYAYTLGSSLGRLTPSGEAEINTWDSKPTNSRVEFQSRLMTLFDLTWFNIWYGETTDTCLYPADYTWAATVREMNRHKDAVQQIGAAKPVIDVAILHGWETVCGINRADIAAAHKTFCLNTAELFVERSVAFDWVDTRLLAESRIENERLINALGSYSVLVLPYASVLPRAAWEKCLKFADAGGKLIFTGTPPELDLGSSSLRSEFAKLMGIPELSLETYLSGVDAVCTLPNNRPDHLDVCYELSGVPARRLTSIEGKWHGIRNETGNVVYLSDLDPRESLLQVIEPWLDREVTCYSDSILWRLYRDEERELLICIAREGRVLRGLIRWAGEVVEFRSGTSAILEKINGALSIHAQNAEHTIIRTGLEFEEALP